MYPARAALSEIGIKIALLPLLSLQRSHTSVNTQQQLIGKLHDLIKQGDDVDRCYAIRSLAAIHAPDSSEILIECLRDDDIDVCVDAAEALGKVGGASAAGKLLESLMNDPEGEIKTACIKALAELGDSDTIPHFIAMAEQRPDNIGFDDNEWDVWWDMQLESIKALGNLKAREAIPAFRNIIEQGNYLDIENELYNAAAQIGHEGDELLLSLLETGTSRARRRVIKALGNSNTQATLKPLARALQDEDPEIRSAALQALPNRQHAIYYLPVILHLLKDSDASVRRAAVQAVTTINLQEQPGEKNPDQASLIQKLLPLLGDSDPYVLSSVIDTLLQLQWTPDRQNSDRIIALLSSGEGDGLAAVCRFISAHRLQQALPDLLNLFKKRQLRADQKARILACIGDLEVWNTQLETMLGTQLFDTSKSVRIAALETLASLDKNSAAETGDDEHRQPIDMIIEALQGSLQVPVNLRPIPVTTNKQNTSETAQKATAETAPPEEAAKDSESTQAVFSAESEEGKELLDSAFKEIRESIEDGDSPQPMSTLDSMAISCVERQINSAANLPADQTEEQKTVLSDAEKEELKEFLAISEANTETAKWLFSKEKVSLNVDIQRLAAKMISFTGSALAIPSLLQVCQHSDDVALKREILLSLGKLVRRRTDLPSEQAEMLQALLLDSLQDKDRSLRIAAARTLGGLGDGSDISRLIACLDDPEVAMRVQCLNSIQALVEGEAEGKGEVDYAELAEQILVQFDNNEVGIHRAAIDALLPLLNNKLNGNTQAIREAAIARLITAGLSGSDGQVREMSQGMNALDKDLSSRHLLTRLDNTDTSVERRYLMEMLAELHRPASVHLS